jgi:hypothetical protein
MVGVQVVDQDDGQDDRRSTSTVASTVATTTSLASRIASLALDFADKLQEQQDDGNKTETTYTVREEDEDEEESAAGEVQDLTEEEMKRWGPHETAFQACSCWRRLDAVPFHVLRRVRAAQTLAPSCS